MNQTLQITERKIKDDLKKQRSSDNDGVNPPKIDNFVVKQVEQKWEVEFSKRNIRGDIDNEKTYILAVKRGGVRKFARLSGVLKWMKKIGIREFKVVLSDLN